MALRNEEILRLKFEMGYNITGLGAEPYITYSAIFDKAVQPYLIDISTTSNTAVLAATTGAIAAITVASNPVSASSTQALSFVVGSAVIVDVGVNQETSVIQSVTGLIFTMQLFLAHSGTYSLFLNGAEQTVRDILARLDAIKSEMLNIAPKTAGIEQVDEVRLFSRRKGTVNMQDKFAALLFQRDTARRDLAGALGVPYLPDMRRGNGSRIEAY